MRTLVFLWRATRGYRLRPWQSAYLRWRVETYTGLAAEQVRLGTFLRLAWQERRQMMRFAGWLGEMAKLSADTTDRVKA